jgi:emp24/gp25L/p24 family/GOLD
MIVPRMQPEGNMLSTFPTKKREQLEKKEGSFEYETGDLEGSLEICVQSYTATVESPSRVALSFRPESEDDEIEKLLAAERKLMNERLKVENRVVKEETSRITAELMRMQRRAKSLASDAQFSKQREEAFHNQSISLNRAVKFWPMVRMVVLLIGGYLQVTHVIKFMKSRHIY